MDIQDLQASNLSILRQAIENYYTNPDSLSDEQVSFLTKEASKAGIRIRDPRGRINTSNERSFLQSVGRFLGQPLLGYLEGFSTFKIGAIEPETPVQGILRSIGHLGGFISPWGVPRRATDLAGKAISVSVPTALKTMAVHKLRSSKYLMLGANVGRSAAHLGFMSAVSNWQQGVDGMMKAFLGGAEAGAGYHLISYLTGGRAQAVARILAGSIYTGLPATLRGDTAPEQVYQYLLGAWFTRHGRKIELDQETLNDRRVQDLFRRVDKWRRTLSEEDALGMFESLNKVVTTDQAKLLERVTGLPVTESVKKETEVRPTTEVENTIINERLKIRNNPIYDITQKIYQGNFGKARQDIELLYTEGLPEFRTRMRDAYSTDDVRLDNRSLNRIWADITNRRPEVGAKERVISIFQTPGEKDKPYVLSLRKALNYDPETQRPLRYTEKFDNMPDGFYYIRQFVRDGYNRSVGRELDSPTKFKELQKILRQKGLYLLGSSSDHDYYLVSRERYPDKEFTKEAIVSDIHKKYGITLSLKDKKDRLQEQANFYSAIGEVWNEAGVRWFQEKYGDRPEEFVSEAVKRLQIPTAKGDATHPEAVKQWNREHNKTANDRQPTLLILDDMENVLKVKTKEPGDGHSLEEMKQFEYKQDLLGYDKNTDARKSFHHEADPGSGMAYSEKSATFKANETVSKFMQTLGVSKFSFTTGAKVTAGLDNKVIAIDFQKGRYIPVEVSEGKRTGRTLTIKEIQDKIFYLNPNYEKNLKYARREMAGEGNVTEQPMLRQMLEFIEPTIIKEGKRVKNPAYEVLWNDIIEPRIQTINQRLQKAYSDPKEFNRLVREILREEKSKDLEVGQEEYKEEYESGEAKTSMEDQAPLRIFRDLGWDRGLLPLSNETRYLIDTALAKQILKDIALRPRWPGIYAVIRPLYPDMKGFSGKPLSVDGVYLPTTARKIRLSDGRTLGEVIDAEVQRQQELKVDKIRVDLNGIFARSPVSAVNAVSPFYVEGFNKIGGGRESATVIIHPEAVKKIKGDFDIDAIHMFFDVPKELRSYFENVKNIQDEQGYIWDTVWGKEHKSKLKAIDDVTDEFQRWMMSQRYIRGKQSVGIFANNITRWMRFKIFNKPLKYDWKLYAKGDRTVLKLHTEKAPRGMRLADSDTFTMKVLNPAKDKQSREALDRWLNTATDPKSGGIPEREFVNRRIAGELFDFSGTLPDGFEKLLWRHPFFKTFTQYRSITSRDWEGERPRELGWNESAERLQDMRGKGAIPHILSERIISQLNTSPINTETFLSNQMGRVNSLFKRYFPGTAIKGMMPKPGQREFDRLFWNGITNIGIMNRYAVPIKADTYDLKSILNLINVKEKPEPLDINKRYHRVVAEQMPFLKGELLETLQKINILHKEMTLMKPVYDAYGERIISTKPKYTPVEKAEFAEKIQKTAKEYFDKLPTYEEKERFLWLLDLENRTNLRYRLAYEWGMPEVMAEQAREMLVTTNQFLPEPDKIPVFTDETAKDKVDIVVKAEKLEEPQLKSNSIWNENVKPSEKWKNDEILVRFYDKLKRHPQFIENFEDFIKWRFGTHVKVKDLTYGDIDGLVKWFDQMEKGGGWIVRLLQGDKPTNRFSRRWFDDFLFPEKTGERLMPIDIQFRKSPLEDRITGCKQPVNTMQFIQEKKGRYHDALNKETETFDRDMKTKFSYIVDREIRPKHYMRLQEIAWTKYESQLKPDVYKKAWDKLKPEYDKLSFTDKHIVNRLTRDLKTTMDDLFNKDIKQYDELIQEVATKLKVKPPKRVGFIEWYLPHIWHTNKQFKSAFIRRKEADLADLRKSGATKELIQKREDKWNKFYDQLIGDREKPPIPIELDLKSGDLKFRIIRDFGNARARRLNLDGYNKSFEAITDYHRRIREAYWNTHFAYTANREIKSFRKRMKGTKMTDKQIDQWTRFMTLYARDNLGYPSKPDTEFKHSFYNVISDRTVIDKWNKVMDKLGKPNWKATSLQDAIRFSNAEAQYEMGSLLFSSKTYLNNVYGGSTNTIIRTGFNNWFDALKIQKFGDRKLIAKYVPERYRYERDEQGNIKREFGAKEAVDRWMVDSGVIEEFMEHELFLGKETVKGKIKDFMNEVVDHARDVGFRNVKWDKVSELGTKYRVRKSTMNQLAFFMRTSERYLRSNAFIAGYIQARKMNLPEDAALQFGRKVVRATQYLYHNAFRPAFARTALGKILSRFQLWTWNSMRFRRILFEEARFRKFRAGTPEFEALRRALTLDLFTFAMGTLFAFSMFESSLPPPYNYAQDTAELLFGDDEDRKKAFFGTYGLSVISPPLSRIPVQTFKALLSNDWQRWTNYYVWTFLPMGRQARDVRRFIQSPEMFAEAFGNVPLHKGGRYLRQMKKEEPEKPIPKGLVTGVF